MVGILQRYSAVGIIIIFFLLSISCVEGQNGNDEVWVGTANGVVRACCAGECKNIAVTASGQGTVSNGIGTGTAETPAGLAFQASAQWGMKKGAKISGTATTAGGSATWTGKRTNDVNARGTWKGSYRSGDCSITGSGTWSASRLFIKIIDAKMVSPNELGIGIQVMYPAGVEKPRKVKLYATIDGKFVEQSFDLTDKTKPGILWGGKNDEMFDSKGKLKPTTPFRINLAEKGVDKFEDNVKFDIKCVS